MGIKQKLNNWYTKPREGEFWNFTNWVYGDKNAFRILIVYGHIASIVLFSGLTLVFYLLGFNMFIVVILAVFNALSIWKAKKLYKLHKTGVLNEFAKSYALKDFVGGKNGNERKNDEKSNGTGNGKYPETVYNNNGETKRNSGKPKRVSKGISFNLLVSETDGGKDGNEDTDTLNPDGD